MISIEQISGEIATLEEQVPTYVVMQKLAALYTVRDHMSIDRTVVQSQASPPDTMIEYGMSDFLKSISGKSIKSVMLLVDELVNTVSVLNPSLYSAFMRNLSEVT